MHPEYSVCTSVEMKLIFWDWFIIVGYFVFALAVGVFFSRRAGKSITEYFVSGRRLPWWIAGTSMVATTFAADTPLAVTGLVANHGIAGNWLWWNFVFSGMLTVFFFSRLWRRVGVLTDVEFTEIRYSGKPAAILRGFRALYLGLPINLIIMGWVTLAMAKIISITLGFPKWQAVAVCLGVALFYSVLSGFWGVVVTDFIQFLMALGGAIALAIISVNKVGGITILKEKLVETYGAGHQILSFIPEVGSAWMPLTAFLIYIGVQWWATWYPGSEPGGGGYVAQRMFSTRDERHSLLATLWFNIAHYAIRPWPWILVALVAMVVYPHLPDPETGYPRVMVDFLPAGLRGMMVTAFLAAFMSTIDTQLNWSSSYIINDFYKRFLKKDASDRHYVMVSRIVVVGMMGLAALVTSQMESVGGAWKFLISIGAGTGAVYILRWYWWRINAWSEISAMVASFVGAIFIAPLLTAEFTFQLIITVIFSTTVWLVITFLTPPESEETLIQFYRRVHPGGSGWRTIARQVPDVIGDELGWRDFADWICGCVLIFCFLFGVGKLLFGDPGLGLFFILVGIGAGSFITWDYFRRS